MDSIMKSIHEHNKGLKEAIFKSFDGGEEVKEVVKGISIEEFNEKYTNHEVYDLTTTDSKPSLASEIALETSSSVDSNRSSFTDFSKFLIAVNDTVGNKKVFFVREKAGE